MQLNTRICRMIAGCSITAMTFMRGLLVRIGDVGTGLGQEVQGIEHAEVRLMAGVDNI
jgi:hypothetical protein